MEKLIDSYISFIICIVLCFGTCLGHVFSYSTADDYSLKPSYYGNYATSFFDVKNFGAKGDGKTDDSKAFLAAFGKACQVNGGVILVPSGSTFLLQPISFDGGNCQPNVTVQVFGKIVAPSKASDWVGSANQQWIRFQDFINGLIISGNGVINGQGQSWWPASISGLLPPHGIKIVNSKGVIVSGITIQNSPFYHLFILSCQKVTVFNITTSSPQDSPNTDGIHLSRTQNAEIHHCNIASGDDCVSIQSGVSNVRIYNMHCGPGHGYSIGGLGRNKTNAQVSGIDISNSTVANSLTGVRIKTWQGGSGSVFNISFKNIQMNSVKTGIVIDQYYCGGENDCNPNLTSAVAISNVSYYNITGTYTKLPVSFNCSMSKACRFLNVDIINLNPVQGSGTSAMCFNAFGKVLSKTTPPLQNCLKPEQLTEVQS